MSILQEIPDDAVCANCHEHKATIYWAGDSGLAGVIHGWLEWWCQCCCTRKNLEHAKEQAALIPQYEEELKAACHE